MGKDSRNAFRPFRFDAFLTSVVLVGLLISPGCSAEEGRGHGKPGHGPRETKHVTAVERPGEGAGQEPEMAVQLTPEMLKLSDIKTAPVEYRPLARKIQTVGEIAYDERRVKVVSAWIGGRIDKLYVDFTGVDVQKAQPLVELYSPDLVSTQEEYLLALETRDKLASGANGEALTGAEKLVGATRRRLLLWGISETQLAKLENSRTVNTQMVILAPIGGTVIHKNALEGQYVMTGQKLYTIADLSVVWAMADIYEYEMAGIKQEQKVAITSPAYPERTFTGVISFIDPFLNSKTRTVKVRIDIPNKDLILKPGMFVETRLKVPYKRGTPVLAIPRSAVLDTGVRKLAYVDMGKGLFKGVEIETGPRTGNWFPVLSGLKKGQRIAVSANYLIDSQRSLGAGAAGEFGGALGGGHAGH